MKNLLKGLILYSQSHSFYSYLESHPELSQQVKWQAVKDSGLSGKSLKEKIADYDLSIIADENCFNAYEVVKYRAVGSHFLKYIDLVSNQQGTLWGHSIFSEVFREVLLKSIQNQDYKGSVIFLGHSPLALPVIDVLARFGFEDFVFLEMHNSGSEAMIIDNDQSGLLGVKISHVDSADFIQSEKEYSFCFVMEETYPQQILEDMSYFHFLSSNSLVFDLVGDSNFLFKEVAALGVDIMAFATIREIWAEILARRVGELASNLSKMASARK